MNIVKSYPKPPYKLVPATSIIEYIERELFTGHSPFISAPRWRTAVVWILVRLFKLINRCFGQQLFVENQFRELSVFDRPARRLLTRMLAKKQLVSWQCWQSGHGHQPHWICSLTVGDIFGTDGALLVPAGRLKAHGAAQDLNHALKIALAEAIERTAASQWSESSFLSKSITDMERERVSYVATSHIRDLTDQERNVSIKWGTVQHLLTGNSTYMPASMLYIFYNMHHPSEPMFFDPSSNAIAAHVTQEKAILHAFYEAVERDGLLLYWLNTLSPQKIDTETIPDAKLKSVVSEFKQEGVSIHLLDCKTELNIPVVVSVAIHDATGRISVNAAAGPRVDTLIEKVITDTLRWDLSYRPARPQVSFSEIQDLREREQLWYGGYMREYLDFFLSGAVVTYDEYKRQFVAPSKVERELEYVKRLLRMRNMDAYYYDLTNQLAAETGLHVVRVIVPELIPMYFTESNKHVHLKRVKAFPRLMGFSAHDTAVLNEIPHPFI